MPSSFWQTTYLFIPIFRAFTLDADEEGHGARGISGGRVPGIDFINIRFGRKLFSQNLATYSSKNNIYTFT
jgi:hypothetical protein